MFAASQIRTDSGLPFATRPWILTAFVLLSQLFGQGCWQSKSTRSTTSLPQLAILKHPLGSIEAIAFASDQRTLFSAGGDRDVHVWNPAEAKAIAHLSYHSVTVIALAVSPDGQCLASADERGAIALWDIQQLKLMRELQPPGSNRGQRVSSLVFSPDSRFLVSAAPEKELRVWNRETGTSQLLGKYPTVCVESASYVRAGRGLATVNTDGTGSLWDLDARTVIKKLSPLGGLFWKRVASSPKESVVALADSDGGVLFLDETSWESRGMLSPCKGNLPFCDMAMDSSGTMIARTFLDYYQQHRTLISIRFGKRFESEVCFYGNQGSSKVAFDARGEILASAGGEDAIYVWACLTLRAKQ